MSSPPPPPGWNPPPPGGSSWPPPPGGPQPGGGSTPPPFVPPGAPPPYGGPGTTPPPFGLPPGPPQPPRRSNTGPLLAAIIGGGLVVLLVIGVAAFFLLRGNDKSPTERLASAATDIQSARALNLRGTFGPSSDQLQGEVKVTKSGYVTGPVTWDGNQVTLLTAGDSVYVKANKDYWSKYLTSTDIDQFVSSGDRWGKIESSKLTFNFKQNTTPSALANRMRSVGKYSVQGDATKTTLQGQKAVKITTSTATYYLAEDDDRLLRIESVSPAFSTDVGALSASQAGTVVSDFRSRIGEFKDALDTTKTATVSQVSKCEGQSVSGCTVPVRVSALSSDTPTQALVYVWITADTPDAGKRLGDCTVTVTVPANGSQWTKCRVSGSTWSAFYGQTNVDRRWTMRARATAAGTSSSDIQNLQNSFNAE